MRNDIHGLEILTGIGKTRVSDTLLEFNSGISKRSRKRIVNRCRSYRRVKKKILQDLNKHSHQAYFVQGFAKGVKTKNRTFKNKTGCSQRLCLLKETYSELACKLGSREALEFAKSNKLITVYQRTKK